MREGACSAHPPYPTATVAPIGPLSLRETGSLASFHAELHIEPHPVALALLNDISEGLIRKGFEEIVEITPVCLKGLPGFLQARLREQKVASELVGGDTRTPLPIDLVHGSYPLLPTCSIFLSIMWQRCNSWAAQQSMMILNQPPVR